MFRILLTGLISAPTIRQYYSYVTDPQCKVSPMIVSLNVTDMDCSTTGKPTCLFRTKRASLDSV